MNKSKYINFNLVRSHNVLYNWLIGIRGCGKTYGALLFCVQQFIKHKYRFCYVRRTEEELKRLTTTKNGRIFNYINANNEFPKHLLWAESNNLYFDKSLIGYATALTTAHKMKSDAMENVHFIVFDEFLIDTMGTSQRYLSDEVTAFLEFYETVARPGTRDYTVYNFFLGNAILSTNPYFDYFGLDLPYKCDLIKRGEHLVQLVAPPSLIKAKKKTRFYKSLEGTAYEAYAVENKFLRDNKNFICKKNKNCEYQFTLIYYNERIGVWKDYRNGRFYISDDVDKQCKAVFAVTTETQEPNTLILRDFRTGYFLKALKDAYSIGCVYYESQKLYRSFRDIIKLGGF